MIAPALRIFDGDYQSQGFQLIQKTPNLPNTDPTTLTYQVLAGENVSAVAVGVVGQR